MAYFQHKLAVDNFAGGGGASTGIEGALGRPVDIADNHDLYALGMHRLNHPFTEHLQMDVFDVDPAKVTKGRTVGLAHFSPDCTHHSKAKGGKPVSKRIRGLCLVMLRWAKIRAEVLTMENVEEIKDWCPLIKMWKKGVLGEYPDLRYKGRCWQAFLACLSTGIDPNHPDLPEFLNVLCGDEQADEVKDDAAKVARILAAKAKLKPQLVEGYGYRYEVREIRGYSHGAPTIRNRLFMIARCDGKPIVWPEPTHGDPKRLKPGMEKWRTIAECLDFSLPCHSIFLTRKQARKFKCKRPLAKNTLRRVAVGVGKFVIHAAQPYIVNLTHQGADRVESIHEPGKTITGAKRGEKALVKPEFVVNTSNGEFHESPSRVRCCDEPLPPQTGVQKFAAVGTATAPFITDQAHTSSPRSHAASEPMRAQCAGVKRGHLGLVSANLIHTAHGERDSTGKKRGRGERAVTEPHPTITSSPDCALIAGALVTTGYGERPGQEPRTQDLQRPGWCTVAGGTKAGLAAVSTVKMRGRNIGSSVEEPGRTASAGGQHHGLVAASLVGAGGPAYSGKPTGVDKPGGTQTTENHSALVAASMVVNTTGHPGHRADEPGATQCTGGHHGLVASSLTVYNKSGSVGQSSDRPLRTPTTKARMCDVESLAVPPPLSAKHLAGARRVAAFLRSFGVQFEGEFATVQGHIIWDIGMRMLTPRELFRAQGFGDDYVIDRAWIVDPKTGQTREVKLTKEQQIRMCGNSVCPPVMEAIVRANVPDMIEPHPPKKWRPTLEVMKAAKIAA